MRTLHFALVILVAAAAFACGGGGATSQTSSSGSGNPNEVAQDTPTAGEVRAHDKVVYRVTTSDAHNYAIQLDSDSEALSWGLYSDSALRKSLGQCSSGNCALPLNANTTYFLVIRNSSNTSVDFTAEFGLSYQQGFLEEPILLTFGSRWDATVDDHGASFYYFWSPIPGTATISISDSNTSIGWGLFSDSGFETLIAECADFSAGFDQSCEFEIAAATTYYLALAEFDGVVGAASLLVSLNEGTPAKPISLNLGSSRVGTTDPSGSSYYQFTVGYDGAYSIGLYAANSLYNWLLFDSPSLSHNIATCDEPFGDFFDSGTRNCTVYLTAGTYYLQVQNLAPGLGYYTLLIPGGLDEGSVAAPVPLEMGTKRGSTVDALGSSFYNFETPKATSAVPFQIAISNSTSARMGWFLYTDSSFSDLVASCGGWHAGNPNPSCSPLLEPATSYYLIAVESDGTPSEFGLIVTANEGQTSAPVAVAVDTRRSSTVGAAGGSFYVFTPAVSGEHVVALTGLAAQLSWTVYDDAAYSNPIALCSSATFGTPPICPVTLDSGTPYYLKVQESSGAPQAYNLFISSGTGNQGSATTPVSLPAAALPVVVDTTVTVAPFGESFFAFNTGAPLTVSDPSNVYWIAATGLWTDVSWKLYDDAEFTNEIAACEKFTGGREREQCEVVLTPNTVYYLAVSKHSAFTSPLNNVSIYIQTRGAPNGGAGTGSIGSPTNVTFDVFGLSSPTSMAGKGVSYFKFTPASTDSYVLTTTGRMSWSLFSDSDFSTLITACASSERAGSQSCATGTLTGGTTYYLTVTNDSAAAPAPCCLLQLTKVGQDLFASGSVYLSEGSQETPVALSLGVDRATAVNPRVRSYYTFTTTSPGPYFISATPTSDFSSVWYLYSDAGFSQQVAQCVSDLTDSGQPVTPTACSVALSPTKTYYLAVEFERDGSPFGQAFTLRVDH